MQVFRLFFHVKKCDSVAIGHFSDCNRNAFQITPIPRAYISDIDKERDYHLKRSWWWFQIEIICEALRASSEGSKRLSGKLWELPGQAQREYRPRSKSLSTPLKVRIDPAQRGHWPRSKTFPVGLKPLAVPRIGMTAIKKTMGESDFFLKNVGGMYFFEYICTRIKHSRETGPECGQ